MRAEIKSPGAGWQPGRKSLNPSTLSLPQAEESEIQILGAIIQEGNLIEKADLSPNDFYSDKHHDIFSVMKDMEKHSVPIDVLTLFQEVQRAGKDEITGGSMYLTYLIEITPSTATFDYHIKQVKNASHKRRLWEKAERLKQALGKGASREEIEKLRQELGEIEIDPIESNKIISLASYKPKEMAWLLKDAIPDKFPTTIYGDGGLGKSYLGLYFATLATLGKQRFLGLEFPQEPLNVLYVDYELDVDEFSRRALKIAKGLGLSRIPDKLSYYSPEKSLYKLLPKLKGIISSKKIQFLVIDSLGAACVDPDDVGDIVEVFSQIKNLGIATLILDHQSKMQSQDNYSAKTPYGSVYKYNLSRSVFQLSTVGREDNQISLMLRHKKSNFGRLLDDLIFDVSFEGDRVQFFESKALSPEEKDMMMIWEALQEMKSQSVELIQKNLINHLRGVIGKDKLLILLDKGQGKYWDIKPRNGRGGGKVYEPKEVFWNSDYIYTRKLENLEDGNLGDVPEVIS